MLQSLRKKVRQIVYTNQGHLPIKATPVIDFTDEPVIQGNVLAVENTSVDDLKYVINMENKRYKLLQINFDVNNFIYCVGTNFVLSFSFLRN